MSNRNEYIFTHIGEIADYAERKACFLQSEAMRELARATINWFRNAAPATSN